MMTRHEIDEREKRRERRRLMLQEDKLDVEKGRKKFELQMQVECFERKVILTASNFGLDDFTSETKQKQFEVCFRFI